ncbi:MAG: class I SAM-dependent methyltransferase [Lachnospiraceae bacterium]|jgi:SAM-dependent methyltransferase|nr:class I SAM-dependent methyltransferase [Lachnospiraceae bacterium]
MNNYTDINAATIDRWIESGNIFWSKPISHETYLAAVRGAWPFPDIPKEWFPPLKGKKVLGLASGGGQQMPVFAAYGADCTLLDYSKKQLDSDRLVAEREGYRMELVQADMAKRFPFENETFDVIFHPVCNIYIEDVYHIWNECSRVLKHGGVLIASLTHETYYLFDDTDTEPLTVRQTLPWNPLKNATAEELQRMVDNDEGLEFSHSITENIGGQLKAGFILTELFESRAADSVLGKYMPQNYHTRAYKP